MYNNDIVEFMIFIFPIFMILLFLGCIITAIVYVVIKNSDNNKIIMTRRVRVLDKPIDNGNVAWYLMQDINGNRIRLRTFAARKLLITVGDSGIVKYRGQTIESFQRY